MPCENTLERIVIIRIQKMVGNIGIYCLIPVKTIGKIPCIKKQKCNRKNKKNEPVQ
jgi:hypothetical protein